MKDAELTQEVVRELLDYNPETGIMTWKERDRKWFKSDTSMYSNGSKLAGKEAGGIKRKVKTGYKYKSVRIMGKDYLFHRVVWLWMTGRFPDGCIDHINRDATDNRWCNLRVVSRAENSWNISKMKNNTSGVTGVYWHKDRRFWYATVHYKNKKYHLGSFAENDFESAAKVVEDFRREHGFSEDHGKEYAHYYKGDNE